MRFLILITSLICTTAGWRPCHAQALEVWLNGGAMRVANAGIGSDPFQPGGGGSDDLALTDGWRVGAKMTINQGDFFGHEIGYSYNRTQLRYNLVNREQGMGIHHGLYNFLLYPVREGRRLRPFVSGGGHFNNYVAPGGGTGSSRFGYSYGAGFKYRFYRYFALRFEARQHYTGKPFDLPNQRGLLRQLEVGTGVGLYF